jgi:hypothetical protein
MRALSIRQPYAELILRGIKTVEYRSRATAIIGERFLIYASKGRSQKPGASSQKIWSQDLTTTGEAPMPQWMIELAEQVGMIDERDRLTLPTGVIVGSAVIEKCERMEDGESRMAPSSILYPRSSLYRWHLTNVQRAATLRKPKGHPQPVWWRCPPE